MKNKKNVVFYGNVEMLRDYCEKCKQTTLIINDKWACCERPYRRTVKGYKIEVPPEFVRKTPPKKWKDEQLIKQENKCFYCDRTFGGIVYKKLRAIKLVIEWDHILPYSYSANNFSWNFVAACQVCNKMKSNRIFQTVEEAKTFIYAKWQEKNYY